MEDNIYSGKPSIELNERAFFSIIIPCYNSRNTIGVLLQSIINQHMDDEIEVILSDDNSTESYQDIVEKYNQRLCIKQIKTDYNFAPGNTREKGVSIATGVWVCFADHDDAFIENSLKGIKEEIIRSKEQYYAIANFVEYDVKNEKIKRYMKSTRNWNHAKFYNLDNLWKKYNIHFKKDLLTHEDIYISSLVNCIIDESAGQPTFIDQYCYVWNARPTTVSREKYGNHSFLETFFDDYLESTGRVYLDMWENETISKEYAIHSTLEVLLYCYFYSRGFVFHDPNNYIKKNDDIAREYLIRIKEELNIDNEYIWNYCAKNDAELFMHIREAAEIASGPCIPDLTLRQWLDYMHKDIKHKLTMRESLSK